jgi:hypothetical protein
LFDIKQTLVLANPWNVLCRINKYKNNLKSKIMKTTKSKKATKTSNANNASTIDKLVSAVRAQERTINSLIDVIQSGGNKIVESVRKYTKRTAPTPVTTASGSGENKSNVDYFIEALEQIGRPAMTQEIAARLKHMHPKFKSLSRDKKNFMQIVYSSASHLVKEKQISRKPVGKRSYEYSLKSWKNAA